MSGREELVELIRAAASGLSEDRAMVDTVIKMFLGMLNILDESDIIMVPREPSNGMILAAGGALGELSKTVKLSSLRPYEYLRPQWDAMLKASPYAKE